MTPIRGIPDLKRRQQGESTRLLLQVAHAHASPMRLRTTSLHGPRLVISLIITDRWHCEARHVLRLFAVLYRCPWGSIQYIFQQSERIPFFFSMEKQTNLGLPRPQFQRQMSNISGRIWKKLLEIRTVLLLQDIERHTHTHTKDRVIKMFAPCVDQSSQVPSCNLLSPLHTFDLWRGNP